MPKYDKRFGLKCDQAFLDRLSRLAKKYKESEAWVIREIIAVMDEG